MYINQEYIYDMFTAFNNANIRYVLIKNINLEIPSSLKNGKDIDILVHENDLELVERVMICEGFIRICHPLGKKNGWRFGYQLPEHQFWKKHSIDQEFYVDICFKLSCKSISQKIWIPLDESINSYIWQNKAYDPKLRCWRMEPTIEVCYLIIRCIFDKNEFLENYINEIESKKHLLNSMEAYNIMEKVFFKYTDRLFELIELAKYNEITTDYISFSQY